MKKGKLHSISISPEKGQLKTEVEQARIIENYGIENDGHAGEWDRQITCLNWDSVLKVNREHNLQAGPGDFAENLLIEGLELHEMGVGSKLRIGDGIILQVSQIGKEDHPSIVTRSLGVSLLPYEGLFCKVLCGGTARKGDQVEIM